MDADYPTKGVNIPRRSTPIREAGGAKFWFHGMRNCFITVAEHDLLLPRSLSKRLVNHARSNNVTEGYAADWTAGQLRDPAQRVADRIESLMYGCAGEVDPAQRTTQGDPVNCD